MPKTKVAVLGGGLGGIAAAFELTSTPELCERYEVTVYQQGWRLGGKGASGRNAAVGQRIEEHGLHAFLGFYENAFALMRDAYHEYAQIHPAARWRSWRDAFDPQYRVTIEEWVESSQRWSTWNLDLPRLPGEPGDHQSVPLVEKLVAAIVGLVLDWAGQLLVHEPFVFGRLAGSLAQLQLARLGVFVGDARVALDSFDSVLRRYEDDTELDDAIRRLVLGIQLGVAILRGLADDVIPRGETEGFAYIDQWDFQAWLERNGASRAVSFWGPVRALYDLGFAYERGIGDREHAVAAAGVSLRVMLLLGFGYKDAPLWKMKAGMGDTIFAPLYLVLKNRGVKFEFFHRVKNLGLSATGSLIERIELDEQVRPSVVEYTPLVTVNGLPCWPSEPHWNQITDGATIRAQLEAEGLTLESAWCAQRVAHKTLSLGVEFDRVVLAISVAALPDVAAELIAARDEWRQMLASSATVQTQAVQLWLDRTTHQLGFEGEATIMTGYVEPFDTWGDLTHLLPEESWGPSPPKSLAYFCNALEEVGPVPPYSDTGYPKREKERVFGLAKAFFETHIGHLWPDGTTPSQPNALDYALLHAPPGALGEQRLRAQYWRANVDPTERYVLSPPGSLALRLRAGRTGFINLVVAGDWVYTSINGGCAEAAVEGGLRAAHAMIGYAPRPFTDRHVQDDTTLAEGD